MATDERRLRAARTAPLLALFSACSRQLSLLAPRHPWTSSRLLCLSAPSRLDPPGPRARLSAGRARPASVRPSPLPVSLLPLSSLVPRSEHVNSDTHVLADGRLSVAALERPFPRDAARRPSHRLRGGRARVDRGRAFAPAHPLCCQVDIGQVPCALVRRRRGRRCRCRGPDRSLDGRRRAQLRPQDRVCRLAGRSGRAQGADCPRYMSGLFESTVQLTRSSLAG